MATHVNYTESNDITFGGTAYNLPSTGDFQVLSFTDATADLSNLQIAVSNGTDTIMLDASLMDNGDDSLELALPSSESGATTSIQLLDSNGDAVSTSDYEFTLYEYNTSGLSDYITDVGNSSEDEGLLVLDGNMSIANAVGVKVVIQLDDASGNDVGDITVAGPYGDTAGAITLNISTNGTTDDQAVLIAEAPETLRVKIYGSSSAETAVGNHQDNIIYTQGGDDTILAGDGDDTIYGGSGSDIIDGGQGFDNVIVVGSSSSFTILSGIENIDGVSHNVFSIARSGQEELISGVEKVAFSDQNVYFVDDTTDTLTDVIAAAEDGANVYVSHAYTGSTGENNITKDVTLHLLEDRDATYSEVTQTYVISADDISVTVEGASDAVFENTAYDNVTIDASANTGVIQFTVNDNVADNVLIASTDNTTDQLTLVSDSSVSFSDYRVDSTASGFDVVELAGGTTVLTATNLETVVTGDDTRAFVGHGSTLTTLAAAADVLPTDGTGYIELHKDYVGDEASNTFTENNLTIRVASTNTNNPTLYVGADDQVIDLIGDGDVTVDFGTYSGIELNAGDQTGDITLNLNDASASYDGHAIVLGSGTDTINFNEQFNADSSDSTLSYDSVNDRLSLTLNGNTSTIAGAEVLEFNNTTIRIVGGGTGNGYSLSAALALTTSQDHVFIEDSQTMIGADHTTTLDGASAFEITTDNLNLHVNSALTLALTGTVENLNLWGTGDATVYIETDAGTTTRVEGNSGDNTVYGRTGSDTDVFVARGVYSAADITDGVQFSLDTHGTDTLHDIEVVEFVDTNGTISSVALVGNGGFDSLTDASALSYTGTLAFHVASDYTYVGTPSDLATTLTNNTVSQDATIALPSSADFSVQVTSGADVTFTHANGASGASVNAYSTSDNVRITGDVDMNIALADVNSATVVDSDSTGTDQTVTTNALNDLNFQAGGGTDILNLATMSGSINVNLVDGTLEGVDADGGFQEGTFTAGTVERFVGSEGNLLRALNGSDSSSVRVVKGSLDFSVTSGPTTVGDVTSFTVNESTAGSYTVAHDASTGITTLTYPDSSTVEFEHFNAFQFGTDTFDLLTTGGVDGSNSPIITFSGDEASIDALIDETNDVVAGVASTDDATDLSQTVSSTATTGEYLAGGEGGDTITVGASDIAYGDAGDDTIQVNGSNASVFGGTGDDTVTLQAGSDSLTLVGGTGSDSLTISGSGLTLSTYTITFDGTNVIIADGGTTIATVDQTVETITFTNTDDDSDQVLAVLSGSSDSSMDTMAEALAVTDVAGVLVADSYSQASAETINSAITLYDYSNGADTYSITAAVTLNGDGGSSGTTFNLGTNGSLDALNAASNVDINASSVTVAELIVSHDGTDWTVQDSSGTILDNFDGSSDLDLSGGETLSFSGTEATLTYDNTYSALSDPASNYQGVDIHSFTDTNVRVAHGSSAPTIEAADDIDHLVIASDYSGSGTIDLFESTVNVHAFGNATIELDDAVATANLDGAGDITLTSTNTSNDAITIDASSLSGDLSLTLDGNNQTVVGGTGSDNITIAGAGIDLSSYTISFDGTDVIIADGVTTVATIDPSVETITFTNSSTGNSEVLAVLSSSSNSSMDTMAEALAVTDVAGVLVADSYSQASAETINSAITLYDYSNGADTYSITAAVTLNGDGGSSGTTFNLGTNGSLDALNAASNVDINASSVTVAELIVSHDGTDWTVQDSSGTILDNFDGSSDLDLSGGETLSFSGTEATLTYDNTYSALSDPASNYQGVDIHSFTDTNVRVAHGSSAPTIEAADDIDHLVIASDYSGSGTIDLFESTVNVHAFGNATIELDDAVATANLDGAGDITLISTNTSNDAITIDASSLSGDLSLTLDGNNQTVVGGTGSDNITIAGAGIDLSSYTISFDGTDVIIADGVTTVATIDPSVETITFTNSSTGNSEVLAVLSDASNSSMDTMAEALAVTDIAGVLVTDGYTQASAETINSAITLYDYSNGADTYSITAAVTLNGDGGSSGTTFNLGTNGSLDALNAASNVDINASSVTVAELIVSHDGTDWTVQDSSGTILDNFDGSSDLDLSGGETLSFSGTEATLTYNNTYSALSDPASNYQGVDIHSFTDTNVRVAHGSSAPTIEAADDIDHLVIASDYSGSGTIDLFESTVNVHAFGNATIELDDAVATANLDGAGDITLTSTNTSNDAITIDASSLSGDLSLTLDGNNQTVVGGTGSDNITIAGAGIDLSSYTISFDGTDVIIADGGTTLATIDPSVETITFTDTDGPTSQVLAILSDNGDNNLTTGGTADGMSTALALSNIAAVLVTDDYSQASAETINSAITLYDYSNGADTYSITAAVTLNGDGGSSGATFNLGTNGSLDALNAASNVDINASSVTVAELIVSHDGTDWTIQDSSGTILDNFDGSSDLDLSGGETLSFSGTEATLTYDNAYSALSDPASNYQGVDIHSFTDTNVRVAHGSSAPTIEAADDIDHLVIASDYSGSGTIDLFESTVNVHAFGNATIELDDAVATANFDGAGDITLTSTNTSNDAITIDASSLSGDLSLTLDGNNQTVVGGTGSDNITIAGAGIDLSSYTISFDGTDVIIADGGTTLATIDPSVETITFTDTDGPTSQVLAILSDNGDNNLTTGGTADGMSTALALSNIAAVLVTDDYSQASAETINSAITLYDYSNGADTYSITAAVTLNGDGGSSGATFNLGTNGSLDALNAASNVDINASSVTVAELIVSHDGTDWTIQDSSGTILDNFDGSSDLDLSGGETLSFSGTEATLTYDNAYSALSDPASNYQGVDIHSFTDTNVRVAHGSSAPTIEAADDIDHLVIASDYSGSGTIDLFESTVNVHAFGNATIELDDAVATANLDGAGDITLTSTNTSNDAITIDASSLSGDLSLTLDGNNQTVVGGTGSDNITIAGAGIDLSSYTISFDGTDVIIADGGTTVATIDPSVETITFTNSSTGNSEVLAVLSDASNSSMDTMAEALAVTDIAGVLVTDGYTQASAETINSAITLYDYSNGADTYSITAAVTLNGDGGSSGTTFNLGTNGSLDALNAASNVDINASSVTVAELIVSHDGTDWTVQDSSGTILDNFDGSSDLDLSGGETLSFSGTEATLTYDNTYSALSDPASNYQGVDIHSFTDTNVRVAHGSSAPTIEAADDIDHLVIASDYSGSGTIDLFESTVNVHAFGNATIELDDAVATANLDGAGDITLTSTNTSNDAITIDASSLSGDLSLTLDGNNQTVVGGTGSDNITIAGAGIDLSSYTISFDGTDVIIADGVTTVATIDPSVETITFTNSSTGNSEVLAVLSSSSNSSMDTMAEALAVTDVAGVLVADSYSQASAETINSAITLYDYSNGADTYSITAAVTLNGDGGSSGTTFNLGTNGSLDALNAASNVDINASSVTVAELIVSHDGTDWTVQDSSGTILDNFDGSSDLDLSGGETLSFSGTEATLTYNNTYSALSDPASNYQGVDIHSFTDTNVRVAHGSSAPTIEAADDIDHLVIASDYSGSGTIDLFESTVNVHAFGNATIELDDAVATANLDGAGDITLTSTNTSNDAITIDASSLSGDLSLTLDGNNQTVVGGTGSDNITIAGAGIDLSSYTISFDGTDVIIADGVTTVATIDPSVETITFTNSSTGNSEVLAVLSSSSNSSMDTMAEALAVTDVAGVLVTDGYTQASAETINSAITLYDYSNGADTYSITAAVTLNGDGGSSGTTFNLGTNGSLDALNAASNVDINASSVTVAELIVSHDGTDWTVQDSSGTILDNFDGSSDLDLSGGETLSFSGTEATLTYNNTYSALSDPASNYQGVDIHSFTDTNVRVAHGSSAPTIEAADDIDHLVIASDYSGSGTIDLFESTVNVHAFGNATIELDDAVATANLDGAGDITLTSTNTSNDAITIDASSLSGDLSLTLDGNNQTVVGGTGSDNITIAGAGIDLSSYTISFDGTDVIIADGVTTVATIDPSVETITFTNSSTGNSEVLAVLSSSSNSSMDTMAEALAVTDVAGVLVTDGYTQASAEVINQSITFYDYSSGGDAYTVAGSADVVVQGDNAASNTLTVASGTLDTTGAAGDYTINASSDNTTVTVGSTGTETLNVSGSGITIAGDLTGTAVTLSGDAITGDAGISLIDFTATGTPTSVTISGNAASFVVADTGTYSGGVDYSYQLTTPPPSPDALVNLPTTNTLVFNDHSVGLVHLLDDNGTDTYNSDLFATAGEAAEALSEGDEVLVFSGSSDGSSSYTPDSSETYNVNVVDTSDGSTITDDDSSGNGTIYKLTDTTATEIKAIEGFDDGAISASGEDVLQLTTELLDLTGAEFSNISDYLKVEVNTVTGIADIHVDDTGSGTFNAGNVVGQIDNLAVSDTLHFQVSVDNIMTDLDVTVQNTVADS